VHNFFQIVNVDHAASSSSREAAKEQRLVWPITQEMADGMANHFSAVKEYLKK
jgi:hypothetical protein